MIVVDSSVWSYALRRKEPIGHPQLEKLWSMLAESQPIGLLGIILQEVLQGIRNQKQFDELKAYLDLFPLIELEREDFVAAAELRNLCLAKGVTSGTIDCQIAAACVRRDYPLLTADRDFEQMSQFYPLRLL